MLVTKKIEIDAGHRVPNHKSKCRSLHGHRYFVEAGVDDKVINIKGDSSEGMVIDFSDLKEIMMLNIDKIYDHSFIMFEDDEFASIFRTLKKVNGQKINFVKFVPTAENLAKHWFFLINLELLEKGISLKYVKVWETPTSTAIYTSDDARKETDKNQKTLQQYPMKKW